MLPSATLSFDTLAIADPDLAEVEATVAGLLTRLAASETVDHAMAVIEDWDALRRRLDSWSALVSLHFHQDTADAERKARQDHADEISPRLTNFNVSLKKAFLAHPLRGALEAHLGSHCFALWESDARTFDPSIEADLVEEAKLTARYTELRSSAAIDFEGETHNLSSLGRYATSPERDTRYRAAQAKWLFFQENKSEFDAIFDQLVKLRTKIAHTLGYPSFIELAYDRMTRTDYDAAKVEVFRNEIRDIVVPLSRQMQEAQRKNLGVEKLMAWDEAILDPSGNPKPSGDMQQMLTAAQNVYDAMRPELSDFFRFMNDSNLLDLDLRSTKAGGGFCTGLPQWKAPFVFANFNGTAHDVTVLTHEIGHAFQFYASQDQPISDYYWPTMEACEIHSMSMEFLTYPWMDQFFGADTDRFKRYHLIEAIQFLPYGAAVDHFQHLVYASPDATPDERHAMWLEVQSIYLPDRDFGDIEHAAMGAVWQQQLHIYLAPFYYIDYALAQAVALQFWNAARSDEQETLTRYVDLCKLGGSKPFSELVAAAGMRSPFSPGCLHDVVATARDALRFD